MGKEMRREPQSLWLQQFLLQAIFCMSKGPYPPLKKQQQNSTLINIKVIAS